MKFRHELKYYIDYADYLFLKKRLTLICSEDKHADLNGGYCIRSLYFDNYEDKAMREKLEGLNYREKFRIRLYNNDLNVIKLEKKTKINGLCNKEAILLSLEEAEELCRGDCGLLSKDERPLALEMSSKMKYQCLRPKVIVDYKREPFTYHAGNVRITLDSDIRTGVSCCDLLQPDIPMIKASSFNILEVKYDEFIPEVIMDMLQLKNRMQTAFSKYVGCRIYN